MSKVRHVIYDTHNFLGMWIMGYIWEIRESRRPAFMHIVYIN